MATMATMPTPGRAFAKYMRMLFKFLSNKTTGDIELLIGDVKLDYQDTMHLLNIALNRPPNLLESAFEIIKCNSSEDEHRQIALNLFDIYSMNIILSFIKKLTSEQKEYLILDITKDKYELCELLVRILISYNDKLDDFRKKVKERYPEYVLVDIRSIPFPPQIKFGTAENLEYELEYLSDSITHQVCQSYDFIPKLEIVNGKDPLVLEYNELIEYSCLGNIYSETIHALFCINSE